MKKRLLLIGLPLFLLLLGGGGAGVWWLLSESGQQALEKAGLRTLPGPGYIEFQPFVVPVLRSGQVTHHLTIVLTLEIKSEEMVEPALTQMPRLKDSILREFQGLYSRRFVTDQGFDNAIVRERLKVAGDRVLGTGMVTDIELAIAEKRKPPNV
jgi:flagellar basal body-associated protein FliL